MSSGKWNPTEEWNEKQHKLFYKKLKAAGAQEQSALLLTQASLFLEKKPGDKDLLKAAESLLGYWLLQVNYLPDETRAREMLYQVYTQMNEPEKARAFSPGK